MVPVFWLKHDRSANVSVLSVILFGEDTNSSLEKLSHEKQEDSGREISYYL